MLIVFALYVKTLNKFMYNKLIVLYKMVNDITKAVVAFKLLSSQENIIILKALREKPSKAKDLEGVVRLDRMSIKRRLYRLVEVGLVKEDKVKSKKAIAIIYSVTNKPFPKNTLFQILDKIEMDKASKMTKI